MQVGVIPRIETAQTAVPGDMSESDSSVLVAEPVKSMVSKKIKKHHLPETTETKNLSTAELQRLVLLEQLEVLRLKKRKLLKELEQEEIVTQNDRVYRQL